MWVGEKPNVEHEVGINGQAVLEPERDDGDEQARTRITPVNVLYGVAQLGGGEGGGIEDTVGNGTNGLEQFALPLDGVEDAAARAFVLFGEERMRTPRLFIATQEGFVGGVEIEHLHRATVGA